MPATAKASKTHPRYTQAETPPARPPCPCDSNAWAPPAVNPFPAGMGAGENDNPQGVVSTSDGRVVRAFHRYCPVCEGDQLQLKHSVCMCEISIGPAHACSVRQPHLAPTLILPGHEYRTDHVQSRCWLMSLSCDPMQVHVESGQNSIMYCPPSLSALPTDQPTSLVRGVHVLTNPHACTGSRWWTRALEDGTRAT